MNEACPSQARWHEWLDGKEGASTRPTRDTLDVHLESCKDCRELLERMNAADQELVRLMKIAQESFPSRFEPALQRMLRSLKERDPKPDKHSAVAIPPQIDGYEILEEIGRGGMGVVFKALDQKLHRVVAIKQLAPHLAANAAARTRFLREARSAAAVSHEHVVTIHAVDEAHGGAPYIVMQFVAGRSLQERLDKEGPLKVTEILRIGMQTAAGLEAAHAQGIVHRDVKPGNILLENGVERVKLADFGLARAADDAGLTGSGAVAGSPMFMSPEQAAADTIDHRSDLFSMGAVLYTMAAGHPPFRAPTALGVLKRVCEADPRPLRQINNDVPEWLESIVAKLMEKSPAARFASAGEVAELLGRHLRRIQQPDAGAPASPAEESSALVRSSVDSQVSSRPSPSQDAPTGRRLVDDKLAPKRRSLMNSRPRRAAVAILALLLALGTAATAIYFSREPKHIATNKVAVPLKPAPNAKLDDVGGAAAQWLKIQREAKQRIESIEALGDADCRYLLKVEQELIDALRSDPLEEVRCAAARSLAKGNCATLPIIQALTICVQGVDNDGNPGERSTKVIAAASRALEACRSKSADHSK